MKRTLKFSFLAFEYILIHPVRFLQIQNDLLNKFIIKYLNTLQVTLVSSGNKETMNQKTKVQQKEVKIYVYFFTSLVYNLIVEEEEESNLINIFQRRLIKCG